MLIVLIQLSFICQQVNASSVYITDDSNTAIFPEPSGNCPCLTLRPRAHYEVHGVGGAEDSTASPNQQELVVKHFYPVKYR